MDDMENRRDDWFERHVIFRIDEIAKDTREHNRLLTKVSKEIVALKIRASLWGGLAGLITVIIPVVYKTITGGK